MQPSDPQHAGHTTALDTLAELIARESPADRPVLMGAALRFEPCATFEACCWVGPIRAAIAAVLEERFGERWLNHWPPPAEIEAITTELSGLTAADGIDDVRRQLSQHLLVPHGAHDETA